MKLGRYDERVIVRMVRNIDDSTLRVLVSWIERARMTGMVEDTDTTTRPRRRRWSR